VTLTGTVTHLKSQGAGPAHCSHGTDATVTFRQPAAPMLETTASAWAQASASTQTLTLPCTLNRPGALAAGGGGGGDAGCAVPLPELRGGGVF
jgi:hypothetical protein